MSSPSVFLTRDLQQVRMDLSKRTVEATAKTINRTYTYFFEFSGPALCRLMCEFLAQRGPNMLANSLAAYCHAFLRLLDSLKEEGYETLNAESFSSFTDWLKKAVSRRTSVHLREGTRRGYGTFVLKFMEWLADIGVIGTNELITARLRHQKSLRGGSARQLERMRLRAVSPEDYSNLLRAIRLEYEECKQLLEKSSEEQEEYDITFPLLPFTLLLGIQLAVRSVEFNHIMVQDLRGDRLLLNPPNKKGSELWLPPSLMSSLVLAQKWISRYRNKATPSDPLLVYPLKQGPRAHQLVRFDTMLLSNPLAKFYKKYFNLTAPDGMPYLYALAEDSHSDLLPFSLSFSEFRSAAITEAARHERNLKVVMRFARHESFATTLKYYIKETHRQWITNVARYLAPSAELLRLSLENKIAQQEEEEKSLQLGASVPGGHCESALSGDYSCLRAVDCRLCAFFRIHVSKREFFVKEMESALAQAQRLQSEQGLTRDAQNLREFAALNRAIIDRIDEHLAGR